MYEDLLFIIKNLLNQINQLKFTEEEEEYITGVIKRIIFILLIELREEKTCMSCAYSCTSFSNCSIM